MIGHVYVYKRQPPTAWIIAVCSLVASASSSTSVITRTNASTSSTADSPSSLYSASSVRGGLPNATSSLPSVFVSPTPANQSRSRLLASSGETSVAVLQQPETTRILSSSSDLEASRTSRRLGMSSFQYGEINNSTAASVGESLQTREATIATSGYATISTVVTARPIVESPSPVMMRSFSHTSNSSVLTSLIAMTSSEDRGTNISETTQFVGISMQPTQAASTPNPRATALRLSQTVESLQQQSSTRSTQTAISSSRVDALEPTASTLSIIDSLMSSPILKENETQTMTHSVSSVQVISSGQNQSASMTLSSSNASSVEAVSSILDIVFVDQTIEPTSRGILFTSLYESESLQLHTRRGNLSVVSKQSPTVSSVLESTSTSIRLSTIASIQSRYLLHSSLSPSHPSAALSPIFGTTNVTDVSMTLQSLMSPTSQAIRPVFNTSSTSGSVQPQPSTVMTHSSSETFNTVGSRLTESSLISRTASYVSVSAGSSAMNGTTATKSSSIISLDVDQTDGADFMPNSLVTVAMEAPSVASFDLDQTEATVFMPNSLVTSAVLPVGSMTATDMTVTKVHNGTVMASIGVGSPTAGTIAPQPPKKSSDDSILPTYIWIVVSTAAFILLLLLILACVYYRKHRIAKTMSLDTTWLQERDGDIPVRDMGRLGTSQLPSKRLFTGASRDTGTLTFVENGGQDHTEHASSNSSRSQSPAEVLDYDIVGRRATGAIASALSPPGTLTVQPMSRHSTGISLFSGGTQQTFFGSGEDTKGYHDLADTFPKSEC